MYYDNNLTRYIYELLYYIIRTSSYRVTHHITRTRSIFENNIFFTSLQMNQLVHLFYLVL